MLRMGTVLYILMNLIIPTRCARGWRRWLSEDCENITLPLASGGFTAIRKIMRRRQWKTVATGVHPVHGRWFQRGWITYGVVYHYLSWLNHDVTIVKTWGDR